MRLTPRIDNCFENIVMLTHMAPAVQCDDKSCCLELDMIGMNGFLVKPERIHCCRGNSPASSADPDLRANFASSTAAGGAIHSTFRLSERKMGGVVGY